jgi:isoquinoline 1-oxidoreductase beta subunit
VVREHVEVTNVQVDRTFSRRAFLKVGAAAGGGLALSLFLPVPRRGAATAATAPDTFAPNAFVRIGPDGRVTLVVPQAEMGQGVYTSLPMLIAEELEVDLDRVHIEAAPANDALYANPLLGIQMTGGSTSVRGAREPLRRAGAVARSMLVSAAAQAWQVDASACRAEHGKVTHGATGRTLAYGDLADAAAKLPVPDAVALKDPKDFKLIGTPAKRLDTPDKINGAAQFGIDVKVPGMRFATVAACPVFGGKLAAVDDTRAKAIPGVRQVVRLDDAVAVIGDHMWAAKRGLAALQIRWDEGANAALGTADLVRDLGNASQQPGVIARKEGDFAAGMASATRKLEAVYQLPFLAHATMEPMNCTVHVRPGACDVWVGTQVQTRARATAAEVTGLPLEKVEIHNQLLGGGFGRRLEVDFITQAVAIAKQVDGPVKVVWTREEDMQHDVYRPAYHDRIAAGVDAQGMPIAWSHRVTGSSIVARYFPALFKDGLDFDAVEGAADLPYALPNMLVEYVRREPPPGLRTGWWRGVGPTHNAFVVESFLDELAAAAKRDPLEYRRALLAKSPRAKAVLERAAEKAGWGQELPDGRGRGIALLHAFGETYLAEVAEVSVSKEGEVHVHRVVCAIDCGLVVNPDTVTAQVEGGIAYGLGAVLFGAITVKNGRVEQSNFHNYRVLRFSEAPAIETYLVASAEAPGGVGEPATSCIFPAVTNAIFAATGKRVRKLPVDPAELRTA